jgi:hypothetical protein
MIKLVKALYILLMELLGIMTLTCLMTCMMFVGVQNYAYSSQRVLGVPDLLE